MNLQSINITQTFTGALSLLTNIYSLDTLKQVFECINSNDSSDDSSDESNEDSNINISITDSNIHSAGIYSDTKEYLEQYGIQVLATKEYVGFKDLRKRPDKLNIQEILKTKGLGDKIGITKSECNSASSTIFSSGFANSALTSFDEFEYFTNVTSVPSFKGSDKLESITLHSGVTTIGNEVFMNCTALKTITCKATTPPSLSSNALSNTTSLTTIYVPAGYLSTYQGANNWSSYSDKMVEMS